MGKKLPPDQLALYKRIDEVLYYKWDPIGVSDSAWARDEYQSYLPVVFKLAMEADTPEPMAKYLSKIAQEYMGLMPAADHDLKIAKLVLEIKEEELKGEGNASST